MVFSSSVWYTTKLGWHVLCECEIALMWTLNFLFLSKLPFHCGGAALQARMPPYPTTFPQLGVWVRIKKKGILWRHPNGLPSGKSFAVAISNFINLNLEIFYWWSCGLSMTSHMSWTLACCFGICIAPGLVATVVGETVCSLECETSMNNTRVAVAGGSGS